MGKDTYFHLEFVNPIEILYGVMFYKDSKLVNYLKQIFLAINRTVESIDESYDPKQLLFMIYLVLRMHQFQKYHLLSALFAFMKVDSSLKQKEPSFNAQLIQRSTTMTQRKSQSSRLLVRKFTKSIAKYYPIVCPQF